MRRGFRLKLVSFFTILVLMLHISTLIEVARNHFFHDFLPENDTAYFTRMASRTATPHLHKAVNITASEPCPFNRLLSFLESTVHVMPLSGICGLERVATTQLRNRSAFFDCRVAKHHARAPPIG